MIKLIPYEFTLPGNVSTYAKLHLKKIHFQFIPNTTLCNSKYNWVNSTLTTLQKRPIQRQC